MNRQGLAWLGTMLVAALALGGCQQGTQTRAASESAGGTEAVTSAATVERDVEAPDVFQMTAKGLWDGRPSLGGVWVAHAGVKTPERVMIRNAASGKSVVGALFRRERDYPGPSLQVSSDAAEALGMLAGQPAELSVVALRRKEVVPPAPPAETTAPPKKPAAQKPAAQKPAPAPIAAGAPAAAAKTDAAKAGSANAVAAAAPDAQPEKKSGGLFGLFRKKPQAEPAAAATAAAGAASGPIEQAPLEPLTATATAAIDRAEAAKAAPATTAKTALKRAYVQVGNFSTEANAGRAAEQMKTAGMTATVIAMKGEAKPYWRVIVGPAASEAERDAFAARVKGLGYSDAYPVTK